MLGVLPPGAASVPRARRRRAPAACASLNPPPEHPAAAAQPSAAPRQQAVSVRNEPRGGPLAFFQDKLAADPRLLSKIGLEVTIDCSCTIAAELVARGAAALGAEWVYVCDDLVTTVLLDVAMVSILAPSAARQRQAEATVFCQLPPATPLDALGDALSRLPNSAFESGAEYTALQRLGAAASTAVQYGLLGLACGGAGQAVTNALAGGVAPGVGPAQLPGVLEVALLWSRYMAVSASVRYQLVAAVEGAAERSSLVSANAVALTAVTVAVRLANNVYGAGLFVDMMKESGISP